MTILSELLRAGRIQRSKRASAFFSHEGRPVGSGQDHRGPTKSCPSPAEEGDLPRIMRRIPQNPGHELSNDGVFEKLLDLLDGGGWQFPVNALGGVDHGLHFFQGRFSGRQRLLGAAELLVGEVAGERRAGADDAKTSSFEGGGFISEAGQILFGLHDVEVFGSAESWLDFGRSAGGAAGINSIY